MKDDNAEQALGFMDQKKVKKIGMYTEGFVNILYSLEEAESLSVFCRSLNLDRDDGYQMKFSDVSTK